MTKLVLIVSLSMLAILSQGDGFSFRRNRRSTNNNNDVLWDNQVRDAWYNQHYYYDGGDGGKQNYKEHLEEANSAAFSLTQLLQGAMPRQTGS